MIQFTPMVEREPEGTSFRKITNSYAQEIRRRKVEMGLTQAELGEVLGINQSYVSRLTRGELNISLRILAEQCDALGIEVELVFRRKKSTH